MLCLKTTAFGLDLCRRFFASAPGSAPGSKNRIKLLQAFNIPKTWKLLAQMPFGVSVGPDGEKTFFPQSHLRVEK